jgi:hypothetical protein
MKISHCDLKRVDEIYSFKKGFVKSFQSVLKFYSTLNVLIFAILSLMIIITFHSTFKILFCVSNTKEVKINQKLNFFLLKCKSLAKKRY